MFVCVYLIIVTLLIYLNGILPNADQTIARSKFSSGSHGLTAAYIYFFSRFCRLNVSHVSIADWRGGGASPVLLQEQTAKEIQRAGISYIFHNKDILKEFITDQSSPGEFISDYKAITKDRFRH